ncbi:MAG: diguanylate cyclase [Pseudomonadota bacterium]
MDLRHPRMAELLPLLMAVAGVVGIGPFTVVRIVAGDYWVALLNAILVSLLVVIAWLIYRYRAIRTGKMGMALLCIAGVVTTMYLRGGGQILWTYPALIAMFYLLRPIEAIVVSAIAVGAVTPVLLASSDIIDVPVTFASIGVTLALAAAFSTLTLEHRRRLRAAALLDPLTGAGNRRALTDKLERLIDSGDESVSLLMLDIDHFKRINDRHGHAVGDTVLRQVAQTMTTTMRASDQLFRLGGEEFIVLAMASGLDLARRLGEALRIEVSELVFDSGAEQAAFAVTVSIGIAERLPGEPTNAWYRRVDDALYEAKRSGRNQICLADKTASLSGPVKYTAAPRING